MSGPGTTPAGGMLESTTGWEIALLGAGVLLTVALAVVFGVMLLRSDHRARRSARPARDPSPENGS